MTYKDITILQFQQITNAIKFTDNEIAQSYNILSIITGVDIEVYKAMKFIDFQKECKKIDWMKDAKLPDQWVTEFECQGEKFTIVQHATSWTTEQFISMSNLTKDKNEIVNNLHLILAVMTKGGDSLTEYERRSNLFQNNLSIEIAYPVGVFFAALLTQLSESTQYSLHQKKQLRKLIPKTNLLAKINGFLKSGVGMLRLTKSLQKKTGANSIII